MGFARWHGWLSSCFLSLKYHGAVSTQGASRSGMSAARSLHRGAGSAKVALYHTWPRPAQWLGRSIALCALLTSMLVVLGACEAGEVKNAPNTVSMDLANFHQDSLAIKSGETVHFVNPVNGDPHALCIGKDNQCAPQTGAPEKLNSTNPVTTNPADTLAVVFATPGTYLVICTLHPGMQVTITVQQ